MTVDHRTMTTHKPPDLFREVWRQIEIRRLNHPWASIPGAALPEMNMSLVYAKPDGSDHWIITGSGCLNSKPIFHWEIHLDADMHHEKLIIFDRTDE